MPRRKNIREKFRFEFTYDRYIMAKFDYIMQSEMFDTRADAVKAAIIELAAMIEQGKFHKKT